MLDVNDGKEFHKLYLHCSESYSHEIIPRPFGEQIHATERNHILHYDLIHIGANEEVFMYLLIIKMIQRIPLVHISVQGPHFEKSVVEESNC